MRILALSYLDGTTSSIFLWCFRVQRLQQQEPSRLVQRDCCGEVLMVVPRSGVHSGSWWVLVLCPVASQLSVTWETSFDLSDPQFPQQYRKLLVVIEFYPLSEPETIQKSFKQGLKIQDPYRAGWVTPNEVY